METITERRKKQRARASVAAECYLIDYPAGLNGGAPMVVARLADISTIGMRLDFPGELFPGAKVRIDFVTETGKSASMDCEVVRIENNIHPTKQLTRHGLRIVRQVK